MNLKREHQVMGGLTVMALVIIALFPLGMIKGMLNERVSKLSQATIRTTKQWGNDLILGGASLSVPYTTANLDPTVNNQTRYWSLQKIRADKMEINSQVYVSKRNIGVYKIPVYTADNSYRLTFKQPTLVFGIDKDVAEYKLDDAFLDLGQTPNKEIESIQVKLNGEVREVKSRENKLSVQVDLNKISYPLNVEVDFTYKGSRSVRFLPDAKDNDITINANWPHPKFAGERSPSESVITKDGFKATWNVINFSQYEKVDNFNATESYVEFIEDIGLYQRNERTVKYGVLFVLLTLVSLLILSLIKGSFVHPIQYTFFMVGLVEFYLLLFSLSEQLN